MEELDNAQIYFKIA